MDDCPQCPIAVCHDNPFDRVTVSNLTRGSTVVNWDLLPTFTDPGPYTFQLQVGTTANPDADDWLDVGLPVENRFFAVDGEQRVWGNIRWTHYRVKLTTPKAIYYSLPVGYMGTLGARDWRLAREMIRQELVYARLASENGYLLKRRVTGVKCPICIDYITGECRNDECPKCFGTRYQCGYYYPYACLPAAFSPETMHAMIDVQTRGTINDSIFVARMPVLIPFGHLDVWINEKTDDRYWVHKITNRGELRGVPVTADVELRPIPFSSIVYTIPIPLQDAYVQAHEV